MPSSNCSVASSDLLETGSALGRTVCPWGAPCFNHGLHLSPLIDGSGLIPRRGTTRTQHSPVFSQLSENMRLAQLLAVSHFTAEESQPSPRLCSGLGHSCISLSLSPGHLSVCATTLGWEPSPHTWMAEPPSTAFAEALAGEKHKNSSQNSYFEPTAKQTLRMVITHEQELLLDSCQWKSVTCCCFQRAGGGKNHYQSTMLGWEISLPLRAALNQLWRT